MRNSRARYPLRHKIGMLESGHFAHLCVICLDLIRCDEISFNCSHILPYFGCVDRCSVQKSIRFCILTKSSLSSFFKRLFRLEFGVLCRCLVQTPKETGEFPAMGSELLTRQFNCNGKQINVYSLCIK